MRKGHLAPMHCGFSDEKRHPTAEGTVIPASSVPFKYSVAAVTARYPSRLQHLGPAKDPMDARHRDVTVLHRPHDSPDRGEDSVMMLNAMPQLIAAPHVPHSPHTPPGTWPPRRDISLIAEGRSMPFPALRYAARMDEPTRMWCSGPCMCTPGRSMSSVRISDGSVDVDARHVASMIERSPLWHASHTK